MSLQYSVKIENNSAKVLSDFEKATQKALYAIGVKGVEGSVDAISGKYSIEKAVDTGRLRASISFITADGKSGKSSMTSTNSKIGDTLSGNADEKSVIIGSNVEYAEMVHNGTHKMDERPFIREGIDQTKEEMESQVNKIFKGEL